MKILVFSDSHGSRELMKRIVKKHKDIGVIIFCGDGHSDIENIQCDFPNKKYYCVKGNCDWNCNYPTMLTVTLANKKILVTHGHVHGVKQGLSRLIALGHNENADIMFYGHTHRRVTTADSRMLVMNPGALCENGEYGIVDIDEETGTITASEYPDNRFGNVVIR